MYIMIHFMKNVLTFLFQYDIYQLLLKVSKKAEVALCFERSSLMKGESSVQDDFLRRTRFDY